MRCTWTFKSPACGYRGAETHCDKTSERCAALGNLRQFPWAPEPHRAEQRCSPNSTPQVRLDGHTWTFFDRYDAMWCDHCGWIEDGCGSADCEFCGQRPAHPGAAEAEVARG